jgi:hypothetical protein
VVPGDEACLLGVRGAGMCEMDGVRQAGGWVEARPRSHALSPRDRALGGGRGRRGWRGSDELEGG